MKKKCKPLVKDLNISEDRLRAEIIYIMIEGETKKVAVNILERNLKSPIQSK